MTSSSMTPEQNQDKYRNRRRMAWLSFGCVIVFGAGLLLFGLSSDERAQRVNDLSFLVGALLGVWTTVVGAYYGVTAITDNTQIRVSAGGQYVTGERSMLVKGPYVPPPVQGGMQDGPVAVPPAQWPAA